MVRHKSGEGSNGKVSSKRYSNKAESGKGGGRVLLLGNSDGLNNILRGEMNRPVRNFGRKFDFEKSLKSRKIH